MDMRIYCKLCDEKHLMGRHRLEGVKVRPWLQGWASGGPVAQRFTAGDLARGAEVSPKDVARMIGVDAPEESGQGGEIPDTVVEKADICPGCQKPLPVSATKPRKFHNDACRKRAARAKEKV